MSWIVGIFGRHKKLQLKLTPETSQRNILAAEKILFHFNSIKCFWIEILDCKGNEIQMVVHGIFEHYPFHLSAFN